MKKYKKVPSVLEWLEQIMNAKYVFTDSFHGMVFCILFKKQFVVMNNVAGGTERFTSLLECLGLSQRLCNWNEDIDSIQKYYVHKLIMIVQMPYWKNLEAYQLTF